MAPDTHQELKPLPPPEEIDPSLEKITSAHRALGEIKGRISPDIINPTLIIAPLLTKEAVASSKIEGTQTTVEEVLRYEAEPQKEEDSELREVVNYRQAIYEAINFLEKKPVGEHLVRKLHKILMTSVRGKKKNPGNFRRIAVHIGFPGSNTDNAKYVPPNPAAISNLMSNWMQFLHDEDVDPLIQVGIAHYQFEAIHPFMDGNGRVGRLLIPIILYEKGLIPYPYLYISDFLEQNRDHYYQALRGVDRERNWDAWIHFFLQAIVETSEQMRDKIFKMYRLYHETKEELVQLNSQYAHLLLDELFKRPIISSREAVDQLNQASTQTVYSLIEKFEDQEIVYEITGNKRNKVYAFRKLIDIIR